ncbi:H-2 class II histocompatibility antigen, A-U alpha chain-like [Tachysurus fulvidraco]|uniref:H-2 class II histocompatibility antigen, A-U alpha chain-like n=1 Tax=Tachysurus fulvidraco TaxID=1234273 RepID=UPI000F4DA6EE|nr:H-2 class II histocompatibility antigen, A-U alpha chain-like [Tachysurus fulvidraco]
MKLLLIIFTLSCIKDSRAQIKHVDFKLSGCTESDKESLMEHDDEEIFHSDFKKQDLEMMLPEFADPIQWPGFYEHSVSEQELCKQNLDIFAKAYKNPPEALDAPQNSIYPRDNVQLGSESTLTCHSARFFPPPVHIHWTKNGEDVTDKSTLSQYYPNEDNTYNQFSHLSFTPQEGDIYTCTVEHKALGSADTRTWEVNVELPSVGPSVFCGVGLFVGLLGVATGTFFLVKGNQCN